MGSGTLHWDGSLRAPLPPCVTFRLVVVPLRPLDSHPFLAHRIKPYLGFGVPVGSAYLSARRTFGRPIGRPKVRFNPSPPPCFGRKNGRRYGRTFGRPIGRPYGRTFGRPARPAESTAVPSAGRKYGRTSGRPNRPAESAGRRYGLIRHPPL